jgi:hypothetical protein
METDRAAPVIQAALETRVYVNESGQVTIWQRDIDGEQHGIVFHPVYAPQMVAAIEAAAKACDGD